jgi:hypothetical protein
MKAEEITPYLPSIVAPLYRTSQDEDTKGNDFGKPLSPPKTI